MPSAFEVLVWWAHADDLTDAHLELLDEQERERYARYERQDDRDRFALGSTVVRSLVAELDGSVPSQISLDRTCPRCGAPHGPVTTPGREWRCSLSRSGPFALAAVVAESVASLVGVDLETRCPPDWVGLLPDVVAPGEVTPGDETAFLTLWVRKEAVVKATGEGLSRPLASFSVSDATNSPQISGVAPGLQLVDLDVTALRARYGGEGVVAALAVGAENLHVRIQPARI